jgi:hypothetical protein
VKVHTHKHIIAFFIVWFGFTEFAHIWLALVKTLDQLTSFE